MDIIHVTVCETRRATSQVVQSTLIINTNTPKHIAFVAKNIEGRESISRRRRQKGQAGNLVLSRHARALVVLVAVAAPAVSGDLILHETLLQAEQYA
jgi:hypothetical protein